jgi:outer membrane receptor protein involved in Fe transport
LLRFFSFLLLAVTAANQSAGQDAQTQNGNMESWGDFSFDDKNTATTNADSGVDNEVIPKGKGSVGGQIFDTNTASVIGGVTVTLEWPQAADSDFDEEYAQQQTVVSDERGVYGFTDVPSGHYTLSFFKNGYQTLKMKGIKIYPDETKRADAAMRPRDVGFDDDIFDMGEFAVEFQTLGSTQDFLADLKQQSPGTIDYLTAEDFAKFGGSDLSSVINRLPGVTVVEGQFAVVRGLGDRYNSTLLNGLPISSPDPVRQGLQLDLFPTSIIESVVTQKQFLPNLPSNSSGAAFALQTKAYSEEPTVYFKGGIRLNSNAADTYLKSPTSSYNDLLADGASSRPSKPTSNTPAAILSGLSSQVIAEEASAPIGLSFGAGASNTFVTDDNRKLGIVFAASYNSDYSTAIGTQQDQSAMGSRLRAINGNYFPPTGSYYNGSLFYGQLQRTDFEYDTTASDADVGIGILAGVGYEFDPEGDNKIDFTFLLSQSGNDYVMRYDNSRLPAGYRTDLGPGNGSSDSSISNNFVGRTGNNSLTFNTDLISYEQRELYAYNLTGSHIFDELDDLKMDWGAVISTTTSDTPYETETNYVKNSLTGDSSYYGSDFMANTPPFMTATWREINEDLYGARMDFDYEWEDPYSDWLSGLIETGIFWSQAKRNVEQVDTTVFLTDPGAQVIAPTPGDLVEDILGGAGGSSASNSYSWSDNSRDIIAGYISMNFNLTDSIHITGGGRLGHLNLTAKGDGALNSRATVTNVLASRVYGNPTMRNADLLGYDTAGMTDAQAKASIQQQLSEGGDINQQFILPALAVDVDVTDDIILKAGYSQTLAQPSFREMSPYFSRELSTGDIVLGNPLLETSKVESFDLGMEYRPWEGALIGVGGFYKRVHNPIEQIALYYQDTGTSFLTYFNNPNTATLRGVEFQFNTGLDVIADELENFSFGTNFAYIDARVGFPDNVKATYFSVTAPGTPVETENSPFGGSENGDFVTNNVPTTRRLFDQPEYIFNAYITYDNPDWGSMLTLSVFAQSDVLTSVGTGSSMTVDQFSIPYYSLDLTFQQEITENLVFAFRVTNITDTVRGIFYDDTVLSGNYTRQEYRVGQTYTLSLTCSF